MQIMGKEAVRPERRWTVLLLLALGLMISFVDRTSMSAALADHRFVAHFALTNVERGWLGSAMFWSYGLLQMPMGWLVDRYGVKWPYSVCFLLWCLAAAATGLVTTLSALILVRLVIGAAEAVVVPATYRYLADHFDETRKGTALGIYSIGGKMGPALGAPLAAWLIAASSWNAMFVITGLAGLVWLLPWQMLLPNDFPSRAELAAAKRRAASVPLGNLLASPVVWGGLITNFCYSYFAFYCMTWMPAYLVEQRGLSLRQSGLYTFFSFAGIALVAALAGWAADRLIARGHDAVLVRKSFIVAGFVGGTTVLFGAYAPSLQSALFWNVTSLSLVGLVTANNLALVKLTLIPKPAVGLNTGLQQVATSLAGGVSASLSGWLLHVGHSYTLPMAAIFGFLLLGATSTVVLLRRKWAPKIKESGCEEPQDGRGAQAYANKSVR
ncbi:MULTISPECIES: MFS transporter [Burkholderia]|uniref:MFS transporter n=4 Tax=Burkholderia multivorans TaxID=87883 RepID=A0A8E2URR2_9BURK|nr:MFS transporter [Burkholderia multivorans]EEE00134.1 major facilitator superfamily MFS_1 [Burkholderia multivorans CGD1]EEE09884.1 major facilitator superfamily MFS_1 [Burkholderia multivorans CGD2]EEE15806.1 major facilitator superfamily MFS_1 [Burkholderia multivorans CGD2M]AJY15881.1 major Facilitator Superfamily protein [Burkholderia multivorans ATCC BAA-247]AOJ95900.1 MFS transporter [Burkholderia multivorans]